ncbi:MAG: hypothetical protein NDJ94_02370 [Vicinamibacteria bacterium]|nr:hypothetical protein [Vicinamibacteria bacterium]
MKLSVPLLLLALAAPAGAGPPEFELRLEDDWNAYRETALNRKDALGLGDDENRLRAALHAKQAFGNLRLAFRGYVERRDGSDGGLGAEELEPDDETRFVIRQAFAQYTFGPALSIRVGKQRLAWGSGLAWNPTSRLEPPKNAAVPGLELPGAWAARIDWQPAAWAGVMAVAARAETVSDREAVERSEAEGAAAGALRMRFLVRDTDLALVVSGGEEQRTLVGFDLGRNLGGSVALHAEGAFTRGAELFPPRDDETFFRLAAGGLWTRGDDAVALEYFFNGEGYEDAEVATLLSRADAALDAWHDRSLPPPAQAAGRLGYLAAASVPFSGGLGLRRHTLHASWTRSQALGGDVTLVARALFGLDDGGVALAPGFTWALRDDLRLALDASFPFGPEDAYLGLVPVRAALQARLEVLF